MGRAADVVHVLQNVIGNALKFTRPGIAPTLDVRADRRGGTVTVSVRDNGRGVAPDDLERAFGMFERIEGELYPGTGLGLAVCRRILERTSQRIWMSCNDGPGVTVHFTLAAVAS
jgi:signal transduction histidine kinase